ncbi:copper chaperone PCu(A)C [Tianweitania sp. BSSL-BM11]|uniref:Copper chaperone PCu(A)C n=1 Tax=Tianweitania aestuarii TaxID=2814886 RepID=A0ABS5RSC0_9HYPH|nr:copper chaperone PCu(A)C [Tianweitania aestuarii]MBS9719129.1 copper chaperone PCu(A)C [Tianweitania aestuarii]
MTLFSLSPLRAAGLGAALLLAASPFASAHEYKAGSLEIGHPWSRATPPGAKVAAGYLSIKNTGDTADRLVSVTSAISDKGEIHQMSVDSNTGVMTMRPVDGGVEIPAGETVTLEPGGYHLMFVGLKQPAKKGEGFEGTLTFEKAGSVEVKYAVEAIGGKPGGKMDHGAMDHGAMDHGSMDHGTMDKDAMDKGAGDHSTHAK